MVLRPLQFRPVLNSVHTLNVRELAESITSLLKTINPQNPRPESFASCPLNQFSPYLSSSLVTEVIKRQINPTQALFFFNWASNLTSNPRNYSHSRSCYAAISDFLLSRSLFSVAASILEKSGNLDDFFISKFVKASGDQSNLKGAVFWFHRAKSVGNGNCLFSYNALLGVLVKNNTIDLAKSFFDQMLEDGSVKPDVSAYTIMIRGFCKIGKVDDARKVFDEMSVSPITLTFNTLLNGYCQKGDMKNAESLFNQMEAGKRVSMPDTITYTTLIHGYCKIGDFDKAFGYVDEMEKMGLEPNVVTFNTIIYALCMQGKVDEAKRTLTKMRLNGVRENSATCTNIIKGFCFAGRSEEAFEYFKHMIDSNENPDAKCYELIVREYCRVKNPDKALSLLTEMHAKGMNLDVSCFNSVIRSLVDLNLLDKTVTLLKKLMPKMGCPPNFISYRTTILSLCGRGLMVQAEELVLDMNHKGLNLDASLYAGLVKGYCKEANSSKAAHYFKEGTEKGYIIDAECLSVK